MHRFLEIHHLRLIHKTWYKVMAGETILLGKTEKREADTNKIHQQCNAQSVCLYEMATS